MASRPAIIIPLRSPARAELIDQPQHAKKGTYCACASARNSKGKATLHELCCVAASYPTKSIKQAKRIWAIISKRIATKNPIWCSTMAIEYSSSV